LRAIVERVVYETIDGTHSRMSLIDSSRSPSLLSMIGPIGEERIAVNMDA